MIVEVDVPKFVNEEEEDKLGVLTPSMYDQLRRDLRKDGECYSVYRGIRRRIIRGRNVRGAPFSFSLSLGWLMVE